MSESPEVSIVMGVYDGASGLRETMDSILAQEGVSLEFIVVNDGSTDATQDILDAYAARDSRVRALRQENQGLTRALIAGCAAARGEFIARQDCDDVSLPGRLARQVARLRAAPAASMVSCGSDFVGPEGERLYTIVQTDEALQEGLSQLALSAVRGPSHHGSTMFRRRVYAAVGGYRAAFRVAQDLDLWMRLHEIGACLAIPEPLYRARLTKGGISALRRSEQLVTSQAIMDCARARRSGGSDAHIYSALGNGRGTWARRPGRWAQSLNEARFLYFVGSVLRAPHPRRARRYFWNSIRACGLFLPAWIGWLRTAGRS